MIAGFLLLSGAIGILTTGVALALGAPTWIALLAYPVISSMSLLLWASMWSVRAGVAAHPDRLRPDATAG